MVQTNVELVLDLSFRVCTAVVVRRGFSATGREDIWKWKPVVRLGSGRVEPVRRNPVGGEGLACESTASHLRRCGIIDRRGKQAGPLLAGWNRACPHYPNEPLRALTVRKEKRLLPLNWPAQDKAVLVTAKQRFGSGGGE